MAQKQAATTPAKPLWGSIDPSLREATPASDPSTSELAFGAAGATILRKTAVIATLADLELKTSRLREENETLRHDHTALKKNYEDTMAKYSGEMEHLKARVIASRRTSPLGRQPNKVTCTRYFPPKSCIQVWLRAYS